LGVKALARIRTIKPDFFTNEGMSTVSEAAQLLAGGLLCYADDEGYFNAHPGLVKAAVFPLREPSEPVADCLSALVRIGYIRLGTGRDGKRYGHILKFNEHQKVSHPYASRIKKLPIEWETAECSIDFSGQEKFLYVARAGDHYKIGIADRVEPRLRQLQQGCPQRIELCQSWKSKEAAKHERFLHRHFSGKCSSGEWFSLGDSDISFICKYMESAPDNSVNNLEPLRPELNRKGIEKEKEENLDARKARVDQRFVPFRDVLHRYHTKFVGHKSPFDVWFGNRGGKQLKNLLNAEPSLTVNVFEQCMANRARSPNIDHAQPVFEWITHILSMAGGPKGTNGQSAQLSKTAAREHRIIQRAINSSTGEAAGEDSGPLAASGDGGIGILRLEGNAELIPPGGNKSGPKPPIARAAKAGIT
jgi:hypothetical protein